MVVVVGTMTMGGDAGGAARQQDSKRRRERRRAGRGQRQIAFVGHKVVVEAMGVVVVVFVQ